MQKVKLDDVLKYEQPTKYIVETENYNNDFKTPVLTAGKSFILGYTNEEKGLFTNVPVIIFDDFTTAFHYVDFPFKVKSSAMKILKAVENKASLRYLYYKMQTISIDKDLHKRYWISKYSQIDIELPNLATQQKIANILDKADELRQYNKKLIEKYEALTQSLFLDMFGDPVRNEKGFPLKKLEELYISKKEGTKCGPFGGALKKDEFVEKGIPVWNMDNINKKGELVSEINLWITKEKYDILNSYSVINDDIIISRAGTVGKMCVVKTTFEKSIISTNLIRLRLDKNLLLPLFFVSLMTYFKERISRLQTGAEGAFTHMNTGVLNDIIFPYPPIALQNQFAERVAVIEAQKQQAQEALAKSEVLFQGLLQQAFNGELN